MHGSRNMLTASAKHILVTSSHWQVLVRTGLTALPNGTRRGSRSPALALLRTSMGVPLTLTQTMPGGSYWVKPLRSTTSSCTIFMVPMRWGFKPREVANMSMSLAPIKGYSLSTVCWNSRQYYCYSHDLRQWNNHTSCCHLQGECISGQMGRK